MAVNFGQDELVWCNLVVQNALDNPDPLSEWERSFISDQKDRLAKYGLRTYYSEKQWEAMKRIASAVNVSPMVD